LCLGPRHELAECYADSHTNHHRNNTKHFRSSIHCVSSSE
jgi:hypothetical protein